MRKVKARWGDGGMAFVLNFPLIRPAGHLLPASGAKEMRRAVFPYFHIMRGRSPLPACGERARVRGKQRRHPCKPVKKSLHSRHSACTSSPVMPIGRDKPQAGLKPET